MQDQAPSSAPAADVPLGQQVNSVLSSILAHQAGSMPIFSGVVNMLARMPAHPPTPRALHMLTRILGVMDACYRLATDCMQSMGNSGMIRLVASVIKTLRLPGRDAPTFDQRLRSPQGSTCLLCYIVQCPVINTPCLGVLTNLRSALPNASCRVKLDSIINTCVWFVSIMDSSPLHHASFPPLDAAIIDALETMRSGLMLDLLKEELSRDA